MNKFAFGLTIMGLALGVSSAHAISGIMANAEGEVTDSSTSEEAPLPAFTEDFESYEIDGGGAQLGTKWTNAWFRHSGDFDEGACDDSHFSIQADPAGGEGKVLHIDTATKNESFFYLTIKDLQAKNFIITYDVYFEPSANTPWTGINCRKPVDGRYNGVTNVMMNSRLWSNANIGPDMYRSVDDSFAPVQMTGYDGTGSALGYNAADYPEEGDKVVERWLHIKCEVIDEKFKYSINDHPLAMATINKKSALNKGFISFVSCVCKAYYDNVEVTVFDVPGEDDSFSSEEETAQAPTMEQTAYTVKEGEDLTVKVNTYGERITSLKMGAHEVLQKYFDLNGDTLTISKEYLSTLGEGTFNFVLTTNGGSVGFRVTIQKEGQSPASSEGEGEKTGGNGCGGVIAGTFGAVLVLGGIASALEKKKKKEL